MRKILLIVGALLVVAGVVGAVVISRSDLDDPSDPASGSTVATATSEPDGTSKTEASVVAPSGGYEPSFEAAACAFNTPVGREVECGYLVVPEDRTDPDGRQVRLHVAVFESDADQPAGDPVVYLEGGPGGEPLESIEFGFDDRFGPFLGDRQLVIFDQRGTGFSEPVLDCPAYRQLGFELLDQDLEPSEYRDQELDVLNRCRSEWEVAGIDLSMYNSAANAADVADLRQALGFDEWNLFGISYGTRLALTVMRDHPAGVRSVILDSTYPPEADGVTDFPTNARRAFDTLFSGCAADLACTDAYGDVEARLFGLVDTLNEEPLRLAVTDLLTGDRYEAVVGGDDLLGLMFQSLYSEQLIPSLPKLITDVEAGSTAELGQIISIFLVNGEFLSPGMHFSVQCNEEVAFADPAAVAVSADGLPYMEQLTAGSILQTPVAFEFCDAWGSGSAESIENEPVNSDLPTLVLAGNYDPITPPSDGAAVAERLGEAFYFEFPNLGHGVSTAEECPLQITLDFLTTPGTAPDATCIDGLGGPDWVVPSIAGEVAPIGMVPFEAAPTGLPIVGVVPEGWDDQSFGTFARLETGFDQTALVVQGFPGEFGQLVVSGLVDSLNLDGEPQDLSPFQDGAREWDWISGVALGSRLDILTLEEDGNTLLIVLVSSEDDRDALVESVLAPVAAALQAG